MKKAFLIVCLSLTVAACQKADNVVIDTSQPVTVELSFFSGDSVDIAQYINKPAAQLVLRDSFNVVLSSPGNFNYLQVIVTNDSGTAIGSGQFSEITDSTVSGSVLITPTMVYVGDLTYTFTAYNKLAAPGNSVSRVLRLFNSQNHPPVIDSVSAPDSVKIDSTETTVFSLYATASDPDGLNDLKSVYFDTFKPNGAASSGNPFAMYDDGGASGNIADGDSVAHDGIYTLTIQLPPLSAPTPPALGTYTFKFYAVDRSGAVSAPVTHDIKVYR